MLEEKTAMRTVRIIKVIFYPAAAMLQFFVLPSKLMAGALALGLLGLAAVNLSRLLGSKR